MKTLFTEKDLAFKSNDTAELIELALTYLEPAKPGVRNELSKMIKKCKNEGLQAGKKNPFTAGYDKKRGEYFLFIKDQYEPSYQLAMLFELLTESQWIGESSREIQIRKEQIQSYLGLIEKNEELNLSEEQSQLIQLSAQLVEMLALYQDEDQLTDEEIERLSDKIDLSLYQPISNIIESILNRLMSGNMAIDVDYGEFPIP